MPNVLKQIQDLGGICWDRYITGSNLRSLYINSKLDQCAVNQINFNSNLPIDTGINGSFNNTKIFTDYNNNYFAQKTTTPGNEFSIELNSSNQYLDLNLLNANNGIFNEINLHTDFSRSNINLLNSNTKDILINTSDIPNGKEAKFRCIKFNPNETEQTCIKILSTKEILLKCCGSGEFGEGGGGGAGGGGGVGGVGGGGGSIGLGGTSVIGGNGSIGLDGIRYIGSGPVGLEGESVRGDGGFKGLEGAAVKGSQGVNGDGSSEGGSFGQIGLQGNPSTAIASVGLEGESVRGDNGSNGLESTSPGAAGTIGLGGQASFANGSAGDQGPSSSININLIAGPVGAKGATAPDSASQRGSIGSQGIQNPGPYPNAIGFQGQVGDQGTPPSASINPGGVGQNGLIGIILGNDPVLNQGSPGPLGYLEGAAKYLFFGDVTYGYRARMRIHGISGFLNPYNKNDTTNNPVVGSDVSGPAG